MRIHSDILTVNDFSRAISAAGLSGDVWVDECSPRGSRKRQRAHEVRLAANPGRDIEGKSRRPHNDGKYGAERSEIKAATYNEHGWWMAELYKLDPEMIIGNIYFDVNSFNERTRYEFA
jgi:hypothetical protein